MKEKKVKEEFIEGIKINKKWGKKKRMKDKKVRNKEINKSIKKSSNKW
jgi:hypothetical protein